MTTAPALIALPSAPANKIEYPYSLHSPRWATEKSNSRGVLAAPCSSPGNFQTFLLAFAVELTKTLGNCDRLGRN